MKCEDGQHGEPLVASEPYDGGTYVNVDYRCPICGVIVASDSWTKEGWEKLQAKETKRPKGEPRG